MYVTLSGFSQRSHLQQPLSLIVSKCPWGVGWCRRN